MQREAQVEVKKLTMTSEGNKGLTQGFSFLPRPLSGANKTPILRILR